MSGPGVPLRALTPETVAELAALGSAALFEAQSREGALDSALRPLDPMSRLAGPALTVAAAPGDNPIIHVALTQAKPGDVLVVDARGYTGAGAWSDILALATQQRGVAGLVIDGAVRDADVIVTMGCPVFSRGICIKAVGKNRPGTLNEPIACGNVRIEPGDSLVGDRHGLVALAHRNFDSTLHAARERANVENRLRQGIRAGKLTIDLLNLRPALKALGLDPTGTQEKIERQ